MFHVGGVETSRKTQRLFVTETDLKFEPKMYTRREVITKEENHSVAPVPAFTPVTFGDPLHEILCTVLEDSFHVFRSHWDFLCLDQHKTSGRHLFGLDFRKWGYITKVVVNHQACDKILHVNRQSDNVLQIPHVIPVSCLCDGVMHIKTRADT